MASIRLSDDVEAIAQQVSDQRGLGSTRTAIEAIVRCYWKEYLGGSCPAAETALLPTNGVMPMDYREVDAAKALDDVI
jgi:sulfatase maturation enzyme AslB (radical SAM superfamily)